jgi:hypothetical protein
MSFKDFCFSSPLIRWMWGLLPSRCQYPDCENNYLRWTEHRLEALNNSRELMEWYHICTDCVQRLRRQAFKNGWERIDNEDAELSFRTFESESERPEPLE